VLVLWLLKQIHKSCSCICCANSYGLVFTNRAIGLVFSGAMLYYTRPRWSKAVAYEYSLPAVTNMLSSWCQYEALKFVTFPTQVCVAMQCCK
jgi:hypothetical protein